MASATAGTIGQVSDQDIIIAVMGATGVGKSSFINSAIRSDDATIGHDLGSCTQEIRAERCSHPDDPNRKIVLLDTPGFDDTYKTDTEVLVAIADWLNTTYEQGILLTGLLFLHRISDNRMTGTSARNTHMFEMLCGIGALQNVTLVTTMWDVVDKATGTEREKELRTNFWKPMISSGSRIARFDSTSQSAWDILGQLPGVKCPLQLQTEMVDEGKSLIQTAAGSALFQFLSRVIIHLRAILFALQARLSTSSAGSDAAKIVLIENSTTRQNLEFASGQKNLLVNHTNKRQTNHTVFSNPYLLPTLNITLYETLVVDLPRSGNALERIRDDRDYVNYVVDELSAMIPYEEIRQTSCLDIKMIYRRLIVYTIVHLLLWASTKGSLSELMGTLQQWKTWDDITIIQNHHSIKHYLCNLFQRSVNIPSNSIRRHNRAFRKLVTLDFISLCAHLTALVTDNDKFKDVLALRGPDAQSMLNLLQARLDLHMDPAIRPRHTKALLKLTKASRLYPECLVLKVIDMDPHPIAVGTFGDVFKGLLHNQVIAVKTLRVIPSEYDERLKEFSSEAVLWRQLRHPNVLPFYGVYVDMDKMKLGLTSPWMANGNIVQFLKVYPNTYCVHLALDIAKGLQYLHDLQPSVIHSDLKGANVLITPSIRACLADFGLSRPTDSGSINTMNNSTPNTRGTVRWQAPELLGCTLDETELHQLNNKPTDMYAFACLCYEIFSGHLPFYRIQNFWTVRDRVKRGQRPIRPSDELSTARGLTDEVWNLVEICWSSDPTQRLTAADVVERLQALPNQPMDERSVDDFGATFPSRALYKHSEDAFSALDLPPSTMGNGSIRGNSLREYNCVHWPFRF